EGADRPRHQRSTAQPSGRPSEKGSDGGALERSLPSALDTAQNGAEGGLDQNGNLCLGQREHSGRVEQVRRIVVPVAVSMQTIRVGKRTPKRVGGDEAALGRVEVARPQ